MFGLIVTYKYLLLLPLAILEGPAISIVSGYISQLGYLNLLLVILVLVLADILSDVFYYSLGYFSTKNNFINKLIYNKISSEKFSFFKKLWADHFFLVVFFGKISYGLSVPIIMSAGILKINIIRFLSFSVPVSLFQTSCLVLAGYILGGAYRVAIDYIKYPTICVGIMFLIVVGTVYYLKFKASKVLIK